MAVVHPLSDVPRTKLTSRSTTVAKFPPAISQDFEMDLDMALVKGTPERITEPLIALNARSTEVSGSLLSDAVDESSDIDTLDDVVEHPRRGNGATVRQASGAEDAFQSYLRDIRGLGLLTHAEEIDLAQRAAAGDEFARRKLIESNLRLVIAIARRYTSTGVPLIDLIQEGNLQRLMRAPRRAVVRKRHQFFGADQREAGRGLLSRGRLSLWIGQVFGARKLCQGRRLSAGEADP